MTTDVLVRREEGALAIEDRGGVEAAGTHEDWLPLAEARHHVRKRGGSVGRVVVERACAGEEIVDRPPPADAARGGRQRPPLRRLDPLDRERRARRGDHVDHVAEALLAEPSARADRGDVARGAHDPLRGEEAEREDVVVTRRPHRDRDDLAVDADLERLLDRDDVVAALAAEAHDRAHRGASRDRARAHFTTSHSRSSVTSS